MQTLGEILRLARDNLDEPTENRWKDVQLRRWANEGVRDIARRTHWYRKTGTVASVAGTQEYTFPADCITVHDIRWTRTGETQPYSLDRTSENIAIRQYGRSIAVPGGSPTLWWPWGYPGSGTFIFSVLPIPSDTGTFTIHYRGIPDRLETDGTADATPIMVPQGFEDAVAKFVTYNALMSGPTPSPQWTEWKRMYESDIPDVMAGADREFSDQTVPIPYMGGENSLYYGWDDGW